MLEEEAIKRINAGTISLYTQVNGIVADVIVRGTLATGQFLTTSPDGTTANNLLSLPKCPSEYKKIT